MTTHAKRAAVYLDPVPHRFLRFKSIETSRSISDVVNEAVRKSLADDADDWAAFDQRSYEPLVSYETMIKRLKTMAECKIFFNIRAHRKGC